MNDIYNHTSVGVYDDNHFTNSMESNETERKSNKEFFKLKFNGNKHKLALRYISIGVTVSCCASI